MGEINRRYQDEAGRLNQAVAAVCDQAVFMAAGLPLKLKG
jgi:adenosylcobinamide kinase/adenosylcobinamide-phosphate guanylyltransferase